MIKSGQFNNKQEGVEEEVRDRSKHDSSSSTTTQERLHGLKKKVKEDELPRTRQGKQQTGRGNNKKTNIGANKLNSQITYLLLYKFK